MFKNIWYWSNKKWAMIYLACFLMFGITAYFHENRREEVIEIKEFTEETGGRTLRMVNMIEIPKLDSNQIVIDKDMLDKLKNKLLALERLIKMPPVEVHTYAMPVKVY